MNFDQLVSRENTQAVKYTNLMSMYQREDILSFWIADMDLPTAPAVVDALKKRSEHPIFGYTSLSDDYYRAFVDWQVRRNQWRPEKELLSFAINIVVAIQITLEALLEPGDGVIVMPPVYFPFFKTIKNTGMNQIDCPLLKTESTFKMDLDLIREKAKDAKAIILCSPHNPVGRVWDRKELEELVAIAEEKDLYILSDEIHSDLVFKEHTPLPSLNDTARKRTIYFHSTGKSFNLAGLHNGYILSPDREVQEKIARTMDKNSIPGPSCHVEVANVAAYDEGEAWFDEVLAYIKGNVDLVSDFVREHLPGISMIKPEGTYLLWLDFSSFGKSLEELDELLVQQAGVGLGIGEWFGEGGTLHKRLNVACPRPMLEEALRRLKETLY